MELERPKRFSDVLGQKDAVKTLNIICNSSKQRKDVAPHILFEGPPGVGKTTLALAMANEIGCEIKIANAAVLNNLKKIMPYIMGVNKGTIIFIDEIHRLSKPIQEFLFPVIEDYRVDLSNGQYTESITLPKFTLIGATTEGGSLLAPLRDRFKHKLVLKKYSQEDMFSIAKSTSSRLGLMIDDDANEYVAAISRGTPRILNSRLEWVRDFCIANELQYADKPRVLEAMKLVGVDSKGYTEQDKRYLKVLIETVKKTGAPVGLKTLVASTNLSEEDIVNVIEPFLLQQGIILKTARGRTLGNIRNYCV